MHLFAPNTHMLIDMEGRKAGRSGGRHEEERQRDRDRYNSGIDLNRLGEVLFCLFVMFFSFSPSTKWDNPNSLLN